MKARSQINQKPNQNPRKASRNPSRSQPEIHPESKPIIKKSKPEIQGNPSRASQPSPSAQSEELPVRELAAGDPGPTGPWGPYRGPRRGTPYGAKKCP